jgi:hypothetical protein
MDMLWDLIQQRQIGQAKQAADEAATSATRTQKDIASLERVVESLTLTCQAMWELLREQTNLTDEMLIQRMQEVDLRDGKRDGKMAAQTSTCKSCSRINNASREQCIYCGAKLPPPKHVFA